MKTGVWQLKTWPKVLSKPRGKSPPRATKKRAESMSCPKSRRRSRHWSALLISRRRNLIKSARTTTLFTTLLSRYLIQTAYKPYRSIYSRYSKVSFCRISPTIKEISRIFSAGSSHVKLKIGTRARLILQATISRHPWASLSAGRVTHWSQRADTVIRTCTTRWAAVAAAATPATINSRLTSTRPFPSNRTMASIFTPRTQIKCRQITCSLIKMLMITKPSRWGGRVVRMIWVRRRRRLRATSKLGSN